MEGEKYSIHVNALCLSHKDIIFLPVMVDTNIHVYMYKTNIYLHILYILYIFYKMKVFAIVLVFLPVFPFSK